MEAATVSLIISIISGLVGSGALVKLFFIGREWGTIKEKIRRLDEAESKMIQVVSPSVVRLESACEAMAKTIRETTQKLSELTVGLSQSQSKIHGRIDDLSQRINDEIRTLSTQAAEYTGGMRALTAQVSEMLREINNFLKSEATQKTHGHRLTVLEEDLKKAMRDLSTLEGKFSMLMKGGGGNA